MANSNQKHYKRRKRKGQTYATAQNRSLKQRPDYIDIRPGSQRNAGGPVEFQHSEVGYDPSNVWKVAQNLNPLVQMREALKTGKVKVDDGSGNIVEATVGGVDFNIVDGKTGWRFQESCNLEQAKQVFFEGKDKEVFQSKFQEVAEARITPFVESTRANRSGVDSEGHEVLTEDSSYPYPNFSDSMDVGPQNGSPQFRPLGNGPLNQQLYLHDYWDMIAKAFESYHHNPYAHRAIEIIVNFVLGRGFSIVFHEDLIQDAWDSDAENLKLNELIYIWLRDLERAGNLFLRPIFDSNGSLVEIQNLEASTILEVITDPLDVNKVHGYYQQYQSPIQVYGSSSDRQVRFIVNTFAADEVIHVKINNTGSEKLGRSTLYPAFEYLQMVRDYHVASANQAIAGACLIFDWSLAGSPADVQSFATSLPAINFKKPIASVFHTDNAKLNAVARNTPKGRVDESLEAMINAVAIATGVGKEYLGASSNTSRSGALVGTEPPTKHFEQRQKVVSSHIFQPLIGKWLKARLEAGSLPRTRLAGPSDKLKMAVKAIRNGQIWNAIRHLYTVVNGKQTEIDLDLAVDVTFPSIVKGDLAQTIENYAFMQAMGWWSPRRAAIKATQEFDDVKGYDYFEEQNEIDAIGIKPIAAKQAQSLMVDEQHPPTQPGSSNAQDEPRPQSHQPPRSSNKNNYWSNFRNHPGGKGAGKLRQAVESYIGSRR